MEPRANITLRFAFVALSVLGGATLFALLAMWATNALVVAANAPPAGPNAGLFILLTMACLIAGPIGGSIALVASLLILYAQNARAERDRQAA
jgi:hypothetical protein